MNTGLKLLIVGLGNPGSKYESTRHNIGFQILDQFAKSNGQTLQEDKKQAQTKFSFEESTLHLLKPLEYMNLSGGAVSRVKNLYKLDPENILILHDEIDFPFGKIKRKLGGGHAGHNGLRDIIDRIGSKNFYRLRFGVGKPSHPDFEVADYVLSGFFNEEKQALPNLIRDSIAVIEYWIREKIAEWKKSETIQ
ncbi:MAG: aminoacyl-tRNA hydrolase [Leptospiraceae bacterium]|nr:aminoacyl-tRNA hydrolase [Leptospiraceae bacterium]